MTIIAGIDISTRRLDAAILPIDPDLPQTLVLRTRPLPATRDVGQRLLHVHLGIRWLLHPTTAGGDVTSCWIEEPRGPFAGRQLNAVYGACMGAVPQRIARSGIDPQEWRAALGLPRKLEKPAAIAAATTWIEGNVAPGLYSRPHDGFPELDEHQAEALLICIAGRTITWRHHEGTVA